MKNRNAKLLCLALVLALVLTIALAACNPKDETPKGDALCQSLKTSLKNYLASEEFANAKAAATTQDRVPLM